MLSQNPGRRETFSEAVATVLAGLDEGEVLSYGEVAEEAGFPGGARAVGQFLKRNHGYPCPEEYCHLWEMMDGSGTVN